VNVGDDGRGIVSYQWPVALTVTGGDGVRFDRSLEDGDIFCVCAFFLSILCVMMRDFEGQWLKINSQASPSITIPHKVITKRTKKRKRILILNEI